MPAFVRGELAEKYRAVVAEKAKERQGEYYGNQHDGLNATLHKVQPPINTNAELSKKSGVSEKRNDRHPQESF